MEKLNQVLKNIFKLPEFRDGQLEAIQNILEKKDIITIMPTGGGKSLIYQLPSVFLEKGITIVISPLIALMKDQVDSLNQLGINAAYCNSTQDDLEQLKIISDAVNERIRLLYVSPERAMSQFFMFHMKKMNVNFFAIDEAHCVSQWGHDFRPEYRELYKLREIKKNASYIALTATATEKVILDIKRSLDLKNPVIIQKSFYRKNLFFGIEYFNSESEKENRLIQILKEEIFDKKSGRGIVYSATRNKADELQKVLSGHGIKSIVYHAGKSTTMRSKNQESYSNNKHRLMIATNAFGMGIDAPDIRLVLHYQTPASMESYYQEAGRAGRDSKDSKCILFFQKKDLVVQSFIINKESNRKNGENLLGQIKSYIFSETCRQQKICAYFGEEILPCNNCDICLNKKTNSNENVYLENLKRKNEEKEIKQKYEFNEDEINIIKNLLQSLPAIFGKNIIISILKGSNQKKILRLKLNQKPEFGKLKHIPDVAISFLFEEWLNKKILLEKGDKFPRIYLKDSPPITRKEKQTEEIKLGIRTQKILTPEQGLVKALKSFRDKEARRLKWKKFMVLHNATLIRIASLKPKNLDDLIHVKGLGDAKIEKFGKGILSVIEKNE